jgi:hypothetical protein
MTLLIAAHARKRVWPQQSSCAAVVAGCLPAVQPLLLNVRFVLVRDLTECEEQSGLSVTFLHISDISRYVIRAQRYTSRLS